MNKNKCRLILLQTAFLIIKGQKNNYFPESQAVTLSDPGFSFE